MIRTIRLAPDILAALRRGEIPMQNIVWQPHPDHPAMSVWLEVLSPETVRVSDYTREQCPRDLRCYLDRLDIELSQASIGFGAPPATDAPRPPRRSRCHFLEQPR
jgi:hypothetical protein